MTELVAQPVLTLDATNDEAIAVLKQVVDWAGYSANHCDTPWGVYGFTHLRRAALDTIERPKFPHSGMFTRNWNNIRVTVPNNGVQCISKVSFNTVP